MLIIFNSEKNFPGNLLRQVGCYNLPFEVCIANLMLCLGQFVKSEPFYSHKDYYK